MLLVTVMIVLHYDYYVSTIYTDDLIS